MEQKQTFISCIKIKGVPILPPLITPERRKELLEFKKKAVLLEEVYLNKKHNSKRKTEVKDCSKTLVVHIPNDIRQKDNPNLPFGEFKNTNLDSSTMGDILSTDKSTLNRTFESETFYDENISEEDIPKNESSKPRLMRSNSYTLDTPSTILLDYLRRQSASSCEPNIFPTRDNIETISSERILEKPKDASDTSAIMKQKDPKSSAIENIYANDVISSYQPSLEVITTDITVQQINITTSDAISPSEDPELQLQEILKQIPENFAKKIVELVQAQKKEQLLTAQNNELNFLNPDNTELNSKESSQNIISTGDFNGQSNVIRVASEDNDQSELKNLNSQHYATQQSISSSMESRTLPLDISTSSSDSLDDFSLKTFKILDLVGEHNNVIKLNQKSSVNVRLDENEIETNEGSVCSRQSVMQKSREEKAASVIGAHVKGYLVRRLMRTVKVKTIIRTIQDALVCALELQNSETIEEADVDLHRKLIKLVSSACREFHDIFFMLPVREKMDIITKDREKLKKIEAVRTTRSSTEIRQSGRPSYIRYTKSLTLI